MCSLRELQKYSITHMPSSTRTIELLVPFCWPLLGVSSVGQPIPASVRSPPQYPALCNSPQQYPHAQSYRPTRKATSACLPYLQNLVVIDVVVFSLQVKLCLEAQQIHAAHRSAVKAQGWWDCQQQSCQPAEGQPSLSHRVELLPDKAKVLHVILGNLLVG